LQTNKIKQLCRTLGINSTEAERSILNEFVAFQVQDKAQYEAELDKLTQQSAAIDSELQAMMQLKMGLYAELRRAS